MSFYITKFSDNESFNHRSRECRHIIELRKYVCFFFSYYNNTQSKLMEHLYFEFESY